MEQQEENSLGIFEVVAKYQTYTKKLSVFFLAEPINP